MRNRDDGDDWQTKSQLEPAERRNLHNHWIGCVALPIMGYAIVRLLIHILA